MNRLVEALRGLVAVQNDKAYRSPEDQRRVTEAEAALAEYDAPAVVAHTVAEARAEFLEAMMWGTP